MKPMKALIAATAVSAVMFVGAEPRLSAQQANQGNQGNPANQAQLIQTLLTRIEQLEKRVSELEASKPAAAAAATPAPKPAIDASDLIHGETMPASTEGPNLKIAGFSDFNFGASDATGTHSGFTEGQFILHLNSNLSPKVSFMGEISLSARSDAGIGAPPATGFNAEVERSIVRFEHNDYLKLSFGRYHTPINYWNTAFHHGQWLQTSVSRPEMVQFGGRFIPVHFIGGLLEGAVGAGGLNFNYNVGVGNGRGSVISRGGDAGDINNSRAWLVNMFVKPDKLYGLQIGGSAYQDKVTAGTPVRNFREWITSAHVVWSRETPEIIAEFANVRHENLTVPSPRSNSQAYYVQAGYRLPMFQKKWKPYYRWEYIHIPHSDFLFQSQGIPNLAGSNVGLRYDISSFAALKFEYRNQRRAPDQPRINSGFVQTSFTF
jgi:hypothetical protein